MVDDDDDENPVMVSLRCVSLLLDEDNRLGSNVLDILGTGASMDPGMIFAVDCGGSEVTEMLEVGAICEIDGSLAPTDLTLLNPGVAPRSVCENTGDSDESSPKLPDPITKEGDV